MAVNLKEKYHWLVLAACCGLAISSIGICCNSLGVFCTPRSRKLWEWGGDFALHATISSWRPAVLPSGGGAAAAAA